MSFQNPALLYGLFALAIPIIIHFFNFRRTRKVYFSNTRFLKKVKESEATRKRLKHYLILASRLLFLFFLVMAFAQPFLPSKEDHAAALPVTIYLDNSFSMSNEVEEGIRGLDRGVAHLDKLLSLMPATTEYRLLTNEFMGSSRITQSRRELEETLTELTFSSIARTNDEIISRLNADKEEEEVNLFWLSDFQASTAGEPSNFLDSSYLVNVVPMQYSNLSNVYIDSVFVTNPIMITDERVELHVIFRNIGPAPVSELIAKVFVDDIQSGTASVNMEANGRQEIIFDLSVSRTAPHRCKVVFEEFPVTFDNEFNFVLNIPEKIRILEIKQLEDITPVGLVYANQEVFDLTSQQTSNLDYNLIRLADVVVLNQLESIDPALALALNQYEISGGTLLVIPGDGMEAALYAGINAIGAAQLSADSLGMIALSPPDYDNPFFQNVFEERNVRIQMPMAKRGIQWRQGSRSILKYASGENYLAVRQDNGATYLLSSSLEEATSNFSRHALFVPVMYKIATSGKQYTTELFKYTGETSFTYRHDSSSLNDLYALVREDERIIPEQRIDGNRVVFSVPRFTISSGFYELYYGDNFKGLMAFNTEPAESDIRQAGRETIVNYFSGTTMETIDGGGDGSFTSEVSERYVGRPLWREALMLALLFLGVEVLLVRFMP